jgi:hypothetical protein
VITIECVLAAFPGAQDVTGSCDECLGMDDVLPAGAATVRPGAMLCRRCWWAARLRGSVTDPLATRAVAAAGESQFKVIEPGTVEEWGKAVFRAGPLDGQRREVPAHGPAIVRYREAGVVHFYVWKRGTLRTYDHAGTAAIDDPSTISADRMPIDTIGLAAQLAVIAGDEPASSFFEVRTLRPAGERVWVGVQDPDRAAKVADAVTRLRGRHDVYIGAAPRVRRSGTAEDVERVWALWADCDGRESAGALLRFTPAPGVVVASGQPFHVQAWWPLHEPVTPTVARVIGQGLARELGADNVSDPPRVLRPVGSRNCKTNAVARCLRAVPERLALADVVRGLPDEPPPARRTPPRSRDHPASGRSIGGLVRAVADAREGNRNNALHWAACRAREHVDRDEVDPEAAWHALEEAALSAGLGPSEVEATLRSGLGTSR